MFNAKRGNNHMNTWLIICLNLLLAFSFLPSEAKFQQSMSNIIDGDTVDITTLNSYRLAGIDAPENDQYLNQVNWLAYGACQRMTNMAVIFA
jgi:endonuclease YncB( thermonuclease family)